MYYSTMMATNGIPASQRAAGLVTIQLGADLKRDWSQWCAARGLIPGKALRGLVETALANASELPPNPQPKPSLVSVAKRPDTAPKVSRELQFTPSENEAIEAVAKAQGFAFQEWVIAAARAALTKAPGYGQAELEALTQSNAHLAQLVVDLASVRREQGIDSMSKALEALEVDLRQHVETASAAMAQGVHRWQLKL